MHPMLSMTLRQRAALNGHSPSHTLKDKTGLKCKYLEHILTMNLHKRDTGVLTKT